MRTLSARRAAVRAALSLARTDPGKRAVNASLGVLLKLLIDAAPDARLDAVTAWPDSLRGFEDLSFLFRSTQLDNSISQMTIAEASHLYRVARDAGPGVLVEIGRYRGGSTLVLATAMDAGARLVSYDLHVDSAERGAARDAELRSVLERYRLSGRVELVVADSATAEQPAECVVVLVDGDHSFDGVLADYEHWQGALAPGGHLLFHDVPNPKALALAGCEPVERAVTEIEQRARGRFRAVAHVDTLLDLVRTG